MGHHLMRSEEIGSNCENAEHYVELMERAMRERREVSRP